MPLRDLTVRLPVVDYLVDYRAADYLAADYRVPVLARFS